MLTVHTVRVLQGRVEILPHTCHTSLGITLGAVDRLSGSPIKSKAANGTIHGLFCYFCKKKSVNIKLSLKNNLHLEKILKLQFLNIKLETK
jgi:hypothetical protein